MKLDHSIRLSSLDKTKDTGRSRLSTQESSIIKKAIDYLSVFYCTLVMASMRCFSFQTHLCSCQGSSLNSCGVQHSLTFSSKQEKDRKGWSLLNLATSLKTCTKLTQRTIGIKSLLDHTLTPGLLPACSEFLILLDGG